MYKYASHMKNRALLRLHGNVNVFCAMGKVKKKDNPFEIIIKYILNYLKASNKQLLLGKVFPQQN